MEELEHDEVRCPACGNICLSKDGGKSGECGNQFCDIGEWEITTPGWKLNVRNDGGSDE